MSSYLDGLNEQQKQAVTTKSKYVRVVAGAGSGKTRVLTTRVLYLVNDWGIDPRKILALTFTNKATNEMKKRITQTMPQAGLVNISTIHSLGVRILREDINALGLPRNFAIMDQEDQKAVVKEAYKQLGLDAKEYPYGSTLEYISNNKTALLNAEAAKKMAYTPYEDNRALVYEYYLTRQQELGALDFDDLLLQTVRLFKTQAAIRAKWQRRFQFILVDEFQDIDNTQYEMINLLTTEDTFLYVVGDPDQTIYTWRGADINIIINFEKKYQPCQTITLTKNYRSSQMILDAANSVIQHNKNRLKKDLFTDNQPGSRVVHMTAVSEESEAVFVGQKIIQLHHQGDEYSDFAVLYRSNYLSRPLEKAFIDMSIPYVIYGGIRFYERAEIKDMLSYLRMLVSRDDLSYKRIINTPKRGIGPKSVDSLLLYSREHKMTMYQAVGSAQLSAKALSTLTAFNQQIEDWTSRSADMELEQILQMVMSESGYKAMLQASSDPFDAERLENIKELIGDIKEFSQTSPQAKLEDYLAMVALYTDLQNDDASQHVQMMTVHAAKGLEFKNVFVIGLSDGIFPSERTMSEGIKGLEEERRLVYVAFTRARQRLFLTESRGYSYANSCSKTPSRFINEIDEEYVENIGAMAAVRPSGGYNPNEHMADLTQAGFEPRKNSTVYKPGDQVTHDEFGDGVVISVNGNFGTIAFAYPTRTKTISLSFPKLHKKEAA